MNLHDPIEKNFRLDINAKKALKILGLESIGDLLYHFPVRYTDMSDLRHINSIDDGDNVTLMGKISNLQIKKSFKSKTNMSSATLEDITGSIKLVWFHQPYLARMIKEGSIVKVTGKVARHETYGLNMTNPEINKDESLPIDLHDSLFANGNAQQQYGYPIYRESRGITS